MKPKTTTPFHMAYYGKISHDKSILAKGDVRFALWSPHVRCPRDIFLPCILVGILQ